MRAAFLPFDVTVVVIHHGYTVLTTDRRPPRFAPAVHLALNGQQYGPQAAAPYEYLVDDPSLHYGLSPYGTPAPPPPPPRLYGYKQGLDILGQAA